MGPQVGAPGWGPRVEPQGGAPGWSPRVGQGSYPAGGVAPELRSSMLIVLHAQLLPGPGSCPHVEKPGVLQQLNAHRAGEHQNKDSR